ncbi:hypothetical protein K1X22_06610 [Mycolicibacterium farcinogenes]|uniref:hypothetical protein n=1 Tax=Mycolicibacterium farcinogenes TaxID=1802 RepID=UPI001C8DA8F7|nr:hypothetical protein [Mycolicibacterium farcinogenes]QZH61410.1 hypothetical protein K1X22_06610 [Mycolicibacterium farcinogenes]
MDDDERRALIAEGLDPDDPAVTEAVNMVRWELSLVFSSWQAMDDGSHGAV